MSLFQTLVPVLSRTTPRRESADAPESTLAVKPAYEIKETADAYNVTVYLPGVAKDGLELTAEDGQFRLVAQRAWKQPEGWTPLHRETSGVPFELTLTHDNAVEADKIGAELRDGVLRVSLPKQEALKPRKVAVN